MSANPFYSKDGWIFQEFLFLLGHLGQSQLIRQIEYLKVENQILRKKVKGRVTVTASEKRRLLKYG